MSIILVSDVFGVTPALLKISEQIGASSIVDPYEGHMMGFSNEAEAYSCFVKTVGLDDYLALLLKVVEQTKHEVTLVGFSVGASVAWRLSEIEGNYHIKRAYCFYGSQIRHFTEIEPHFEMNLIFPKSEPHFDVVELQNNLTIKAKVNTERVKYLHGFMNFESTNYNNSAYLTYIKFLCSMSH